MTKNINSTYILTNELSLELRRFFLTDVDLSFLVLCFSDCERDVEELGSSAIGCSCVCSMR